MSRLLKASQKQEERIAGRLNGRRTPGSGNGIRKNDVRTSDLSLEMKYTGKKQYTLKAVDLEQGEKHAITDGRDFAFGIEMNGRNWIVLSEDDWIAQREAATPPPHESHVWWGDRGDGIRIALYVHVFPDETVHFTKTAIEMLLRRAGFEPEETDDGA